MQFVGIDPSLTSSGIVGINNYSDIIFSEVFKPKSKDNQRLVEIYFWFFNLSFYRKFDKDTTVVMEGPSFSKFRMAILGEVIGAIKLSLLNRKVNFIEVPPTTLKKFATGKGNATKDQIPLAIYKRWDVEIKQNDIADAYICAQFARAIKLPEEDLKDMTQEMIKLVRRFSATKCYKPNG